MFSPASYRPCTQLCWIPRPSVGQHSAPYCPMISSGEGTMWHAREGKREEEREIGLPFRFLSQQVLKVLSCREWIISRFMRNFDYRETSLSNSLQLEVHWERRQAQPLLSAATALWVCTLNLSGWERAGLFPLAGDGSLGLSYRPWSEGGAQSKHSWAHRWFWTFKVSFNYIFHFCNHRSCAQVSSMFVSFINNPNLDVS